MSIWNNEVDHSSVINRKLHLMGGIEKKAAMEKLGLGGIKKSKRGEWESGMRRLGMSGYERQSESVND